MYMRLNGKKGREKGMDDRKKEGQMSQERNKRLKGKRKEKKSRMEEIKK